MRVARGNRGGVSLPKSGQIGQLEVQFERLTVRIRIGMETLVNVKLWSAQIGPLIDHF